LGHSLRQLPCNAAPEKCQKTGKFGGVGQFWVSQVNSRRISASAACRALRLFQA
jgi:hypothetical protein